jgi:hypothetical protein
LHKYKHYSINKINEDHHVPLYKQLRVTERRKVEIFTGEEERVNTDKKSVKGV